MKKLCLILVALPLIFAACSSPHTLMLKDGRIVETADEPEFDRHSGFYEYETRDGKKVRINKNEVIEIKEK